MEAASLLRNCLRKLERLSLLCIANGMIITPATPFSDAVSGTPAEDRDTDKSKVRSMQYTANSFLPYTPYRLPGFCHLSPGLLLIFTGCLLPGFLCPRANGRQIPTSITCLLNPLFLRLQPYHHISFHQPS